ncbi:T9SS type A sorting domain-containing protein [Candidatus Neomarinimicrobiota bacterium]
MEYQSDRCDGFPVDRPPHGVLYFHSQLEAVANYFEQVSNGAVTIDLVNSEVFPSRDESTITVGRMATYRPVVDEDSSDALLVNLFAESIRAAADSGVVITDYDIIVVFHAGIGQDFAYPGLDPTPLDIPSATIDRQMIFDALGTEGISIHPDSALIDKPGLILPEGQNHIYYDIVEDIFPGVTDYCDVQIGLTGTFALLLGYALGLPPLYDTDDGETGVGIFGLMDIGSNNGQGVIPAPPTAWTRTYLGWEAPVELVGDTSLAARHLPGGKIGKIDLGLNEYFLIENRSNWIPGQPGVSLDTLRYRNVDTVEYGVYELPHYFNYLRDSADVAIDGETGVIVSVPNYDLGLPGSGLLIWHVDESRYNSEMNSINNIPEARAVSLVEADGAVDIGFPTSALFGDPNLGWGWDMWYAGNEAYFAANPGRGKNNPERYLSLDPDSYPSTHLNSGAESGIAISGIDSADLEIDFRVEDIDITRLPEGSRLLGFNGQNLIYALRDSIWLGDVLLLEREDAAETPAPPLVISEHDAVDVPSTNAFWILDSGPGFSYIAQRFESDGTLSASIDDTLNHLEGYFHAGRLFVGVSEYCCPQSPDTNLVQYYRASPWIPRNSMGYLLTREYRTRLIQPPRLSRTDEDSVVYWAVTDNTSLGDIDGDGYDEVLAADIPTFEHYTNERLTAFNADSTELDGFPVQGLFHNAPLVANLMDDIRPEIVIVRGEDIVILGPEGVQQKQLALHTQPRELFLFHTSEGMVGLANGDRIHWFEPNVQNPQWVSAEGRHSRNRYSLNDGTIDIPQPATVDVSRIYNYPNPVTGGRTTIRFYTGTATRASIRIYTIDGLKVTSTELANLAQNDYNEWVWEVGDQPSGLYYGVVEVEGAEKVSALVKIAVVR